MILNDTAIKILGAIDPMFRKRLQPASYDLALNWNKPITIAPGEFALVPTIERVELPGDVCGFIKDKSSFLRRGVFVGQGFVDPGFRGNLTVAVRNDGAEPIMIEPGEAFCQIVLARLETGAARPYDGHYQDSVGVRMVEKNERD